MCEQHHGHARGGRCCPPRGGMRGWIQARLLLLLVQKPSHGYELMERLGQDEEAPEADPGLLYRTLRQFEEDGLLRSTWDTERPGPARRLYEVTPEGEEYLHAWAANIRQARKGLDRFLAEYGACFQEEEGR